MAHVVALLGVVVALVGAVTGTTWVWAPGVTVVVWYMMVAETDDEALRGLLAVLSIPVVLTVAILTSS